MKTYVMLCALIGAFTGLTGAQAANVVVAPKDRFTLGSVAWGVDGEANTATIKVSKLSFNHSGTTGGLKLTLWATTQPYQPGTRGFTIAEVNLGQLKSKEYYHDLNRVIKLVRPPAGTYYLTLMVLENQTTGFSRQLFVKGTNTFTFP